MIDYNSIIIEKSNSFEITNIESGDSWDILSDGNISLSKYNGVGPSVVDIFYSSSEPTSIIKFKLENTCKEDYYEIKFPFSSTTLYDYFYIDTASVDIFSSETQNVSASSKYGITVSSSTENLIVYPNEITSGKSVFTLSSKNSDDEFEGYAIFTEKKTNLRKYVYVRKNPLKVYFLDILDQFGNVSTKEKNTEWKNGNSYLFVYSSSPIKETPINEKFDVILYYNNIYKITPKDNSAESSAVITFNNYDGLSTSAYLHFIP